MKPEELYKDIIPRPRLVYKDYDFALRWDTFQRIAKKICPEFKIDDNNKQIYQEACKYFAADETCIYDLNKGLYVYGDIGVGKTLFFRIFSAVTRAVDSVNTFRILTVNNIIDGYSARGPEYWIYSKINPVDSNHVSFGEKPVHVFIDDMGQSARVASYFGNNIDVVASLIQRRYYAFTENFVLTHASSNISPDKIIKEYGQFTSSRMREMFNVILFPGSDKRK